MWRARVLSQRRVGWDEESIWALRPRECRLWGLGDPRNSRRKKGILHRDPTGSLCGPHRFQGKLTGSSYSTAPVLNSPWAMVRIGNCSFPKPLGGTQMQHALSDQMLGWNKERVRPSPFPVHTTYEMSMNTRPRCFRHFFCGRVPHLTQRYTCEH